MGIKNDSYYIIQGWMINELKLKGTELIIYAIIYGFSQDGESKFTGSLRYLSEFSAMSMRAVQNTLNSLVKKKLINKKSYTLSSVKHCEYRVTNTGIAESARGGIAESARGIAEFARGGIAEFANNKEYINKEIINKDIICENQFKEFYELYPRKKEKQKALTAYLKAIKKTSHEKIMQGLRAYKEDIKKKKTETQYIKYPASWLNAGCWDDDYTITKEEPFDYEHTPYRGYR